LRIHTTIDRPACITQRRYIGDLVWAPTGTKHPAVLVIRHGSAPSGSLS